MCHDFHPLIINPGTAKTSQHKPTSKNRPAQTSQQKPTSENQNEWVETTYAKLSHSDATSSVNDTRVPLKLALPAHVKELRKSTVSGNPKLVD